MKAPLAAALVAGIAVLLLVAFFLLPSRRTASLEDIVGTTPKRATPSASEVFRLRSECAALGTKVMLDLWPQADRRSRYDEATNRCYVDVIYQLVPAGGLLIRALFDGQTGERLIFTKVVSTGPKPRKEGAIEMGGYPRDMDTFEAATNLINLFMFDDRGRGRQ